MQVTQAGKPPRRSCQGSRERQFSRQDEEEWPDEVLGPGWRSMGMVRGATDESWSNTSAPTNRPCLDLLVRTHLPSIKPPGRGPGVQPRSSASRASCGEPDREGRDVCDRTCASRASAAQPDMGSGYAHSAPCRVEAATRTACGRLLVRGGGTAARLSLSQPVIGAARSGAC